MGQLTNSFIRGFGGALGRAAAKQAMQSSSSEFSAKKALITLLILVISFIVILKLASDWSKNRQSRLITFNVKAEDNRILICEFRNSKGKYAGGASMDLFERVDGHLKSIPDSLKTATTSIYIEEPKEEFITVNSDGYEEQTVKVNNRDTINIILRKIK